MEVSHIFLTNASCSICHSGEIEMIFTQENGPMLLCSECGFTRNAEVRDLFQDFLICA